MLTDLRKLINTCSCINSLFRMCLECVRVCLFVCVCVCVCLILSFVLYISIVVCVYLCVFECDYKKHDKQIMISLNENTSQYTQSIKIKTPHILQTLQHDDEKAIFISSACM